MIFFLLSFYLNFIDIFICPCLLAYGFRSMKSNKPLFEHIPWANQCAASLGIKINCVQMAETLSSCSPFDLCRAEEVGRQNWGRSRYKKPKTHILSAVLGTRARYCWLWGQSTALTWGSRRMIHRERDIFSVTHDISTNLFQFLLYSSHGNFFFFPFHLKIVKPLQLL